MARVRLHNGVTVAVLCGGLLACADAVPEETLNFSLSNSDSLVYSMVGGDEEGARITRHPQHAQVSEIRRNAETSWVTTYVYRPQSGYIGPDYAGLEILTGSDGASPPDVRRVIIRLQISD